MTKELAPIKPVDLNKKPPMLSRRFSVLQRQDNLDPETIAYCVTYYTRWMKLLDFDDGGDRAPRQWKGHSNDYVGALQQREPGMRASIVSARVWYRNTKLATFFATILGLGSPPRIELPRTELVAPGKYQQVENEHPVTGRKFNTFGATPSIMEST